MYIKFGKCPERVMKFLFEISNIVTRLPFEILIFAFIFQIIEACYNLYVDFQ